jgi:AraC-like DNA-binding protein
MSAVATISTRGVGPDTPSFISHYVGRTPEHIRKAESARLELPAGSGFEARVRYGDVGNLHLGHFLAGPHRYSRQFDASACQAPASWMLILQLAGTSSFEQNATSCVIRRGDLLLMDISQNFVIASPQGCEQIILTSHQFNLAGLVPDNLVLQEKQPGPVQMLKNMMNDAYHSLSQLREETSRIIGQGLTSLLVNIVQQQSGQQALASTSSAHRKEWIQTFIENHLTNRDLDVTVIARAAGCSPRTIHRLFRDELDCTVNDYIWTRRLARCAEELLNPVNAGQSITDIAFFWGFNSSSHFSRSFKATYGVSPRLFRLQRSAA